MIFTILKTNYFDLEHCRLLFEKYRKVDINNVTVQTEKLELIALKPSKRI